MVPNWLKLLRRSRFWVIVVTPILIALMVVVVLGSLTTSRAATATQNAVLLNTAYQKAATGIAAEESLERKYRLEPGNAPLGKHQAAQAQVRSALDEVEALGTSRDRVLVRRVRLEHASYVSGASQLFAAVDRHESQAVVNKIDTDLVDPIFDALQVSTYAAAARHQALALAEVATTRSTGQIVLGLDVATLLIGMTLIAVAGIALRRSQRRLRTQSEANHHLALHDSLTELPNRALFQDRTAQALQAARRSGTQVAVMLVDLDRFKDVNDTLGHQYGDLLLRQVATRFAATLRSGDSVARLGGDEFAVLLCATSATEAVAAANRLTEVLQAPFTVKDITLDVEASIGIALAGPDADVATALRHADVAMYEAKSQHLPYATYELTRDDNTIDRLALLGDLRRAVSNGELVLQYQPKVSTTSGSVHSAEALVRWHHPTRGLLMPADFIPIAESTAVIHPITTEVIRQAVSQARSWLDRGWRIPVAVNISARSLHDLTFPAQVQAQLQALAVPAELLILELTEGAIMTDPDRALASLESLDTMGVSLSIDDFGTGYSSMAYLKDLPVTELKIDRSFVSGMNDDESDLVLVQSAVDLGHNLGLHVVAEGVEDAATQQTLTAMGCDLLQGYHIRRPVDPATLDQWLETHARPGAHPDDGVTASAAPHQGT